MRCASALVLLVAAFICRADDLGRLPPNTWVEIKYATAQPPDPREKGWFAAQGWNKLVYDRAGKRILFYDRWVDKKHGGITIYGNCLFGFDPAAARLTPIKIDSWTKMEPKSGGYRTLALPANDGEPTPCPRHVYHAFDFVPELKAVFLCNGANQTALRTDGKLVGHDLCDGAWRLDLQTNQWSRVGDTRAPANLLDDAMAYCPDTKSIIYASNHRRQLWILDVASGRWRKARGSPPARTAFGQTIFYDPAHHRMLLVGGGRLDGWMKGKALEFRELYAFDPRKEEIQRLADCPTALYAAHLAYDSKHRVFLAVAVFNKGEQPSGVFCYDPNKNVWQKVQSRNPIPPHNSWFGWMKLCYDAEHNCFIGMIREKFFAFRFVPQK
jgi:hypothetical protein